MYLTATADDGLIRINGKQREWEHYSVEEAEEFLNDLHLAIIAAKERSDAWPKAHDYTIHLRTFSNWYTYVVRADKQGSATTAATDAFHKDAPGASRLMSGIRSVIGRISTLSSAKDQTVTVG